MTVTFKMSVIYLCMSVMITCDYQARWHITLYRNPMIKSPTHQCAGKIPNSNLSMFLYMASHPAMFSRAKCMSEICTSVTGHIFLSF